MNGSVARQKKMRQMELPAIHQLVSEPASQEHPPEVDSRSSITPRLGHHFSQISVLPPSITTFQTKLTVNESGDQFEQEADQVADEVMQMEMPSGRLELIPYGAQHIQRKAASGDTPNVSSKLEATIDEMRSGGQLLDADTRAFMEPRFGHNFANVRIHTDERAVEASHAVNALAFAVGRNIAFGAGQYQPNSDAGRRLIAHELAHTVQQGFAEVPSSGLTLGATDTSLEGTAHHAATAPISMVQPSIIAPLVQRAPANHSNGGNVGGLVDQLTNVSATIKRIPDPAVVTASPVGNTVLLRSPGISYTGRASLARGVTLGADTIQVGIIQTLVSSERTGIYRRNGDPRGELLTEHRQNIGSAPDSATHGQGLPFYEPPQTLTDANHTVFIVSEDQPKQSFPASIGEGKLTETRGADNFTSSLAAKRGNEIVNLQDFAWQVPWSLLLDANQSGTGSDVIPQTTNTPPSIPPGPIANEVGNDPNNTIDAYMSASAAEAALRQDKFAFLRALPRHKTKAPDSYWHMVDALWHSSQSFVIKVVAEQLDSWVGSDTIKLIGRIHNSATQTLKIGDGASAETRWLAHTIYDPANLDSAPNLTLEINGQVIAWAFPYTSITQTVISGKGRYRIEAQLA